jgi:hypothetical protein
MFKNLNLQNFKISIIIIQLKTKILEFFKNLIKTNLQKLNEILLFFYNYYCLYYNYFDKIIQILLIRYLNIIYKII